VLVFAGCYWGAWFGTLLRFPVTGTAILFLPYAVVTAALLLTPRRCWWAFLLAAAAGNVSAHVTRESSISYVLLTEVANATRALVVAGSLRLLGRSRLRTQVDMAFFLVFAAGIGPAVAALVGAAAVQWRTPNADFWLTWEAWLFSNTLTGVTLLPIILQVGEALPELRAARSVRFSRLPEATLLFGGVFLVGVNTLYGSQDARYPAQLYWLLPFLMWAAVRLGPAGTSGTVSIITALTIAGALEGRGPFTGPSPNDLLSLQVFLVAVSVPVLLLAVTVKQVTDAAAALQQSQARYRSVVEDQTEMICRFLADGTYTFVNGAFCRYFGRTAEELLGRRFWMFLREEGHAPARDLLESITIAQPVATTEVQVIGPGGELRWQLWTTRALFDAQERLVEYQAVGRDVTDRRLAEEEHRLLESQRRVEEALRDADRRKNEFLAMLGHELRNPLSPISVGVELLRAQPLTDDAARARDIIGRQVAHVSRLVDDLLDISRITQGKITLTLETVDLARVVSQAVEASRAVIDQHRHELAVSLPALPVYTRADAARFSQILTNLLDNAAKYTQPGGRIDLRAWLEGVDVLVAVRDDGVGIEPDQLHEIFRPFSPTRSSLSATHGGLGIGLTLVKRLVDLHGGRITAHSAGTGKGSEFVVRLPVVTEAPAPQPRAHMPAPHQPLPIRILVVDDNVDAADSLARLLRIWGHTVRVAYDGPSALEVEAVFAPNVVLLDLALPRMDGLEVGRRMREGRSGNDLLLVALTGFGQSADRSRTALNGFDHHLTKPVSIVALQPLLAEWADAHGSSPAVSGVERAATERPNGASASPSESETSPLSPALQNSF
jgi:PAS domain S-box-containing protein